MAATQDAEAGSDEEEEDKRSVTGNGWGRVAGAPNERYAGQEPSEPLVWRYY
jgi:hypothetical protein